MGSATSDWEGELERWLKPLLDRTDAFKRQNADNRHFRDFPLTGRTVDMPKSALMTVNGPFFDRVADSA